MKVYQVGGCVRDDLLGLPVRDRDWVVVGATEAQMLAAGYRRVGADFPVFLHPETNEEYALARRERKTAPGYHGFEVDSDAGVPLEDDLLRRDLTINAMARDTSGLIIDPFDGQADLRDRRLRHVSEAFAEDPVRILRVARFAARYAPLDFKVADETMALMRQMVAAGEVDTLVPERVWKETARALAEAQPSAFLKVLRSCGALARILPEVDALYGVPQPAEHHPEIDTGRHIELVIDEAARLSSRDAAVGYAALLHDLGKGLTPDGELPSHRGHERSGLRLVRRVNQRLRVPRTQARLALAVCAEHLNAHRVLEMRAAKVVDLIMRIDGLRNPARFEAFVLACEADARGRHGRAEEPYPQAEFLRSALAAAADQQATALFAAGYRDAELGRRLREMRIEAVRALQRGAAS